MKAAAAAIATLTLAGLAPAAASPFGAAVGDASLDRVRGGFTSPDSGLQVSIGVVQRAVSVDGNPAAAALSAAGGALLLQRGDGNRVGVAVRDGTAAASTVVQNSLDGQQLRVVTTVDVQTNAFSVSRGMALRSAVGVGIAASLRR